MTTTATRTHERSIEYDRETRDFAMYLDGELVGFARNYVEAERVLDQLVYSILTREAAQANDTPSPSDGGEGVVARDEDGDLIVCDECSQPIIAVGGTLFTTADDSGEYQAAICADCLAAFRQEPDEADEADNGLEDVRWALCDEQPAAPIALDELHWNLGNSQGDAYRALASLSDAQLLRQAVAYAAFTSRQWADVLHDWTDILARRAAETALPALPSSDQVLAALAELWRTAKDERQARAYERAYGLVAASYTAVTRDLDGYLIPSQTDALRTYRVSLAGACLCEAGQHGRPCTHAAVVEGIALAHDVAMADLTPELLALVA